MAPADHETPVSARETAATFKLVHDHADRIHLWVDQDSPSMLPLNRSIAR
ncbi:MAG TPA: hypothetical protein VHZ02_15420 [Acidimicrobiales bacterium]|nr:hypothetical protein [Acidimicrobiales bacterium]